MLKESDRQKLDGIVKQMVQNGEPDQAIQAVVDDFTAKYSDPMTDGFFGSGARASNAVIDTVKNAITDQGRRAAEAVNAFQSNRPLSEKIGKSLGVVTGAANVVFSPVSGLIAGLNEMPGGKIITTPVSLPFELFGKGGAWLGEKAIDAAPISMESKNNLRQPVSETTALAAQIAGGKAMATYGPKVIENTKARVNNAVEATKTKFAETAAPKATEALVNRYRQDLKLTKNQITVEDKWAKDTPEFLAHESLYNPDIRLKAGPNHTLDAKPAISALEKMQSAENAAFQDILRGENKYISLNDFKTQALRSISGDINKGTEFVKQQRLIENEVNTLKKLYSKNPRAINEAGDVKVPIDIFNQIKQGAWSKSRGFATAADKIYNDVNFKMGQTAKSIIESNIEDANVKAINQRLGDIQQAIKILRNRDGVILSGGRLGRWTAAKIGAIAGTTKGVGGALIGALTGEKLAELMISPELTNGVKRWIITRVRTTPGLRTIGQQAEAILQGRLEEQLNRKQLPAPSQIPMGGPAKAGSTPGYPNYNLPRIPAQSKDTIIDRPAPRP